MRAVTMAVAAALLAVGVGAASADRVTAKVVGPDGQPVTDAEVMVTTYALERTRVETRTDASGTFSAEVPRSPRGGFNAIVCIDAPGFAFGGGQLKWDGFVFQLQPAGRLSGAVVDPAGKPVAGAVVRLSGMAPFGDSGPHISIPGTWESRATVKTDASGKWTMTQALPTGTAYILLDDSRFVRLTAMADLSPAGALVKPFVATPGATISGKGVFETGGPVSGARVYAEAENRRTPYHGDATTSSDGSYQLRVPGAGAYTIVIEAASGDWVAEPLTISLAEVESLPAPDLVLARGGIIEGTITDETTGDPVPYITVTSDRSGRRRWVAHAASDQQGHYHLPVLPGPNQIRVEAHGSPYLQPEKDVVTVPVARGETKQVDFRLERGLALTGAAADEGGKPVADARLLLYSETGGWGGELYGGTDQAGGFTIEGLRPGRYTLRASGEWEVVEPADVTVPSGQPLRVVLKKVALATLQGRVVSVAGEPLAGVTLKTDVTVPTSRTSGIGRISNVSTDTQGRYSITGIRPDATIWVSQPEKAGYKYLSGGLVTKQDDKFQVSDIVLVPLGSELVGRVVDAEGQPVAGATVMSPDGDPDVQVSTDSDGRFRMEGLPPGEVTVVAVQGKRMGDARVVAGSSPAQIVLREPEPLKGGNIAWGFAILEEALRKSGKTGYYAGRYLAAELAPYDPDFALRLAQEPGGRVADSSLSIAIFRLQEVNPEKALEWAPAHLEQIADPATRASTEVYLGLTAADLKPALAHTLYQRAKAYYDRTPLPTTGDCHGPLLHRAALVALAARTKDSAADDMLSAVLEATQAAVKRAGGDDRGLTSAVVMSASKGGPEMARKAQALAMLSDRDRGRILLDATEEAARRDPAEARRLLANLEQQGDGASAGSPAGAQYDIAGQHYGSAACAVIEAIGATDPAGALELARKVTDWHRPLALALAARYQDDPTAGRLFREAVDATKSTGTKARIAAMAYETNPTLGRELFAEVRKSVKPAREEFEEGVAEFAFYYARVDPPESRLLIEREYVAKRGQGQKMGRYFDLVPPILAMASVDVERALEMARSLLADDPIIGFDAQRKIAQYVLAPDSVRRTMPFDRWGASDTWTPGTPGGW